MTTQDQKIVAAAKALVQARFDGKETRELMRALEDAVNPPAPKEDWAKMQARLTKAFDLVKPTTPDWRGPIDCFLRDEDLEKAGLTVADVREAIGHFTATSATFERVEFSPHGYKVKAVGYRAGPAGP